MPMSVLSLTLWLVICFAIATIGGRARPGQWYRGISKPSGNAPDWVFAPVRTLLNPVLWRIDSLLTGRP
jgi:translocator protein